MGCASSPSPQAEPSPTAPVACNGEITGREHLTAPLVIMGEIHGTREIPAAFGDLVCHAAASRRGRTILVGLEMPSGEQAAFDAFLSSGGDAAAVRALLAQEFWQRDYQDGRSSQAMLDLLEELRRQRKAGLNVVVRALDPPSFASPGDRDAKMATALAEAIAAVRPAQTLVLIGNVHSRTLSGYPWDPKAEYLPFGALLRANNENLIALDINTLGGSAWICTSNEAAECGAQALTTREPTGPTPRIALDSTAVPQTGYSGKLYMGQVTASSPAGRD